MREHEGDMCEVWVAGNSGRQRTVGLPRLTIYSRAVYRSSNILRVYTWIGESVFILVGL